MNAKIHTIVKKTTLYLNVNYKETGSRFFYYDATIKLDVSQIIMQKTEQENVN